MTDSNKAKRRLKNFDFSKGGHMALTHRDYNGGPANGVETLMVKSFNPIPTKVLKAAQEVSVTLPFRQFLNYFFGMWYEDANRLAGILGYETDDWYSEEDYGHTIDLMKSLSVSDDLAKDLQGVSEEALQALFRFQETFEKGLSRERDKAGELDDVDNADEDVTTKVDKSASNETSLPGDNMCTPEEILKQKDKELADMQAQNADLLAQIEKSQAQEKAREIAEISKSFTELSFVDAKEAESLATQVLAMKGTKDSADILAIMQKAQAAIDEVDGMRNGINAEDEDRTEAQKSEDRVMSQVKSKKGSK